MGALLLVFLIGAFVIGVPVALALGGATSFAMFISGDWNLMIIPQRLMLSMTISTLIAIPMFVLAGNLMSKGGMSKRIVDFAMTLVGRRTGGLALVAIAACMFFAALSGSSSATAAAIGSIMIPEMIRRKYDTRFAGASVASSAELGLIIPPSTAMILYGVATGTSVTTMFIGGILPGIMIGLTLMGVAYFISKKEGYKGVTDGEEIMTVWEGLKKSFFALLMPFIILGGIYGGIFTCTEAAAVAVFYGLLCGGLIYRELKLSDLKEILMSTVHQATMVLLIIGNASLFGYILGVMRVPDAVANFFVSVSSNWIVFMLLVNILLFFVGMIFEASPAILILGPILAPIAVSYGIDPIHFGVVMIVNLAVGMVTPPVGLNLYVTCAIAKLKIEELAVRLIPFLVCLILDVFILAFIPQITTFLPSLMGG